MKDFEAVIGLEVHVQLATHSKIFAVSSTKSGAEPNTFTDPVTLALPGCLPVLNKRVLDFAIKLGLATNCKIMRESILARKHYHYPDLPKGYQISQYDKPICLAGHVNVRVGGDVKRIGLTRIHLEEDAGKSVHLDAAPISLVDLNRAGVPLVEIVSEPDIRNAEEAGAYMRQLRQIVRYLDICDGNMEEGSLRCDANVSVRKIGATEFGTKVEIKNLNSFRYVEKAIDYEIERQIGVITSGGTIVQETRLWDDVSGETRSMRSKEYADDYRYFPDPDLLPLIVDDDWIDNVRKTLPELPEQAYRRFTNTYKLDPYIVELLTEEKLVSSYFDQAVSLHNNPTSIANWITTELFGRLNKEGTNLTECPVSPENLAQLVKLIDDGTISGKIAKTVFDEMFETGGSPAHIVETKGLRQVSDSGLIREAINAVITANPEQVQSYKSGKTKVFGFFVGQVMKDTQGKVNPTLLNELLKKTLDS
ncbi:MAG: Asp-tRNA(Asn)/Glu-tRNA(Gln) amidotransferase subunit GatB [Deltaproteobacteria bacterium]|nr:Asp-tRNA(Asn)/Glu-tRNA(Gln) amidotransferase subunit GatB [Deltaproteobacteria bacterium]